MLSFKHELTPGTILCSLPNTSSHRERPHRQKQNRASMEARALRNVHESGVELDNLPGVAMHGFRKTDTQGDAPYYLHTNTARYLLRHTQAATLYIHYTTNTTRYLPRHTHTATLHIHHAQYLPGVNTVELGNLHHRLVLERHVEAVRLHRVLADLRRGHHPLRDRVGGVDDPLDVALAVGFGVDHLRTQARIGVGFTQNLKQVCSVVASYQSTIITIEPADAGP